MKKYVPTYTNGTLKKDQRRTYQMMLLQYFWCFSSDFLYRNICCGYVFELGTYNICLYKEADKNCTGYNLKTTELLDCALIGVYAIIRSNAVGISRVYTACHSFSSS